MTEQPRDRSGVHTKGRWVKGKRAEADIDMKQDGPHAVLGWLPDGVSPSAADLPAERPADWEPFGNAVDRLVSSVHDGPLSRGVVKGERIRSFGSWRGWAEQRSKETRLDDPEASAAYNDFVAGMEHASIALMSDKAEVAPNYIISRVTWPMGARPRPGDAWRARSLLSEKRTSKKSRAEWASAIAHAPSTAAWRGYLTAAAVLSGTDEWWGLREHPDEMVLAPDEPAPEMGPA